MHKLSLATLSVVAAVLVALPSAAQANHHACPEVTITPNVATNTANVDLSRKDCSPAYVPYPVGGPKSPLPAGANLTVPIALPAARVNTADILAKLGVKAPADDSGSFDLVGSIGPDLSGLRPFLGTPQDSDPADPYPPSPLSSLIGPIQGAPKLGLRVTTDAKGNPTLQVTGITFTTALLPLGSGLLGG